MDDFDFRTFSSYLAELQCMAESTVDHEGKAASKNIPETIDIRLYIFPKIATCSHYCSKTALQHTFLPLNHDRACKCVDPNNTIELMLSQLLRFQWTERRVPIFCPLESSCMVQKALTLTQFF